MTIKNKDIKISLKKSLVDSIEYKGIEVLNTTKNWTKKSPILFPAIGRDKKFTISDVEYSLPKHGFWNEIPMDITKSLKGFSLTGQIEHESYPFESDIEQYIFLKGNKITYTTTVTGRDVPMQFGYHPSFNYDLGNISLKQKDVYVINKDMTSTKVDIDVTNIKDLDWDKVDTFIFNKDSIKLINNDYNIEVKTNMEYIALWTNGDKFISIEPWSNLPAQIKADDNIKMDGRLLTMDIIITKGDK